MPIGHPAAPPAYPLTLFPLQFKRQQAYPIDVDQVFYVTTDRIDYLTSPRRYAGQIVADTQENIVYVLNDVRDAWIPLTSRSLQFQDEGVNLGAPSDITTVNFTGAGVTSFLSSANTVEVNVPIIDPIQFQDEGTNLGVPLNITNINFVGGGVTAILDDSGHIIEVRVPANIILFPSSADRIAYLTSPLKKAGQLGIDNQEGGVYAITPDETAWVDITLPKILTLTADVTLTKVHKQAMLRMNNAGPLNVTFPNDSSVNFEIGTTVIVSQTGAGTVTLVPASGVTLNTPRTLVLGMRHGKVTVTKVAANEWDVEGNLAP